MIHNLRLIKKQNAQPNHLWHIIGQCNEAAALVNGPNRAVTVRWDRHEPEKFKLYSNGEEDGKIRPLDICLLCRQAVMRQGLEQAVAESEMPTYLEIVD